MLQCSKKSQSDSDRNWTMICSRSLDRGSRTPARVRSLSADWVDITGESPMRPLLSLPGTFRRASYAPPLSVLPTEKHQSST